MRLLTIGLLLASFASAVTIATARGDNSRTGANTAETSLTPTNVASGRFGQLGTYTTDGYIYAQPLYIPNLTIAGAPHTCLIVATMHNSVYCFDAAALGTTLWSVNLGASLPIGSALNGSLLYGTEIGIVSTPVVDTVNNLLYAVTSTSSATWILYKLNLLTGATISSVTITASGFVPANQLQRAALTLASGNVYVCFGSQADAGTWQGWIMAYDATSLSQVAFYKTSAAGGAGLWAAGAGPSVDGSGNLYMPTGNGTYNGTTNWGESILKWDASLNLLSSYTPSDWSTLNGNDSDLSSGSLMLAGSTVGVLCAKDYRVYNVNISSLGGLGGTAQLFYTNSGGTISQHSGCYGGTHINGTSYFPNTGGKIYGFALSGTTYNTTPITTSGTYEFPGAILSSSSNGASNTIIWATTTALSAETVARNGFLMAFDSSLNLLYTSSAGTTGLLSKFAVPVVADGRVFVASQSSAVYVYGLSAVANAPTGFGMVR